MKQKAEILCIIFTACKCLHYLKWLVRSLFHNLSSPWYQWVSIWDAGCHMEVPDAVWESMTWQCHSLNKSSAVWTEKCPADLGCWQLAACRHCFLYIGIASKRNVGLTFLEAFLNVWEGCKYYRTLPIFQFTVTLKMLTRYIKIQKHQGRKRGECNLSLSFSVWREWYRWYRWVFNSCLCFCRINKTV